MDNLHANLRPDSKGRITLGSLAKGVSSYKVTTTPDKKIILEPYVEIPEREMWLYQNKEAYESVMQGLDDAKHGRLHYLGSFAKYADDDIE